MTRRVLEADQIGGLLILCFSLAYGALTFDIPELASQTRFTARTLPQFLSVCGIILSSLLIFSPSSSTPHGFNRALHWGVFSGFVLLMCAYGLLIRPAGFLLATTAFLCSGTWLLGERRVHISLPICAIITLLFWLLMTQLLGVYVPAWPGFA